MSVTIYCTQTTITIKFKVLEGHEIKSITCSRARIVILLKPYLRESVMSLNKFKNEVASLISERNKRRRITTEQKYGLNDKY